MCWHLGYTEDARAAALTQSYSALQRVASHRKVRRFADYVVTTAGTANGARVRRWFQAKQAGGYVVLTDPQIPVTSSLLDQATMPWSRSCAP